MSNVKFNPTEGENDKLVSVFSEINDFELHYFR